MGKVYETVPFEDIKEGQIVLIRNTTSKRKLTPCLVTKKESFKAMLRGGKRDELDTHNLHVRELKSSEVFSAQLSSWGTWLFHEPVRMKYIIEEIDVINAEIKKLSLKRELYKNILNNSDKIWTEEEIDLLIETKSK